LTKIERRGVAEGLKRKPFFSIQNLGPMLWFQNYFRPNIWRKHCNFLLLILLVDAKILITTLVLMKNANFVRRKLGKIAENCDHNIDPWS
jgi:hypothetical protein